MVDYAIELQWTPAVSSLFFEPKPFSAVEKYMREDLNSTLRFIRRDDKTAEEKSKVMVEFIEDCYHKFVVKVPLFQLRTKKWSKSVSSGLRAPGSTST